MRKESHELHGFTATKNRVIVHHDLLWPAAAAGFRSKNGRNSQMSVHFIRPFHAAA
jgi:hypothetical protein